MTEDQLSQSIKALEELIRTSFSTGIGSAISARSLARQLLDEISATTRTTQRKDQRFAPDQYTLSLNPDDFSNLASQAVQTQSQFSAILEQFLKANDYILVRSPHLTLATDPTLEKGQQRIIGWHSSDPLGFNRKTTDIMIEHAALPERAFLIVNGKHKYTLGQEGFNIGRSMDNDLVLDDMHVSRQHAQVDLDQGLYHISDLGSKAGIYLNKRLVRRAPLHPGDLITICGYQIIYAEGTGAEQMEDHPEPGLPAFSREMERTTPVNLKQSNQSGTRPMNSENARSSGWAVRPHVGKPEGAEHPENNSEKRKSQEN